MEPMHYGTGKHRPRQYRHSRSSSLSRYPDWDLTSDTIYHSLPYRTRRHGVQRPDDGISRIIPHRHRRASEDLRPRDAMPQPSHRIVRSATTDRSSTSRRRYGDIDDDDDEEDRPRRRLRSRSSSRSSSPQSSRHSESIVVETPPKRTRRYQLPSRSRKSSRKTSRSLSRSRSRSRSRSSSPDSAISVSTQDERQNRRIGKRPLRILAESEPELIERRRHQIRRRRKEKAILADGSDHDGIYEEPLPIAARDSKSPTRPRPRRPADSRSSSQTPHPRERRDSGKHVSPTVKRPSKHTKKYYESEPHSEKPPRARPRATSGSHLPSSHSLGSSSRKSSALGAFLAPLRYPEKSSRIVECVACCEDVSSSKAPKLKCDHRMCHTCMKRLFKLSTKDPSHMPPKCCTSDPIPVKYVQHLFDNKFKRNWNRKFQEYSTRHRVYCPKKSCNQWIKPERIQERNGRKYAKCNRCDTKICCTCVGRWHDTRKCPRDEATRQVLQKAEEMGWQRCFNCHELIELKEGCNHMTCRCGSQFCMICGAKWKSCECPWFSYDSLEAEDIDPIQPPSPVIGRERRASGDGLSPHDYRTGHGPLPGARARQPKYSEEIYQRRIQQQEDEEYARRLQYSAPDDDEYLGDHEETVGPGKSGGQFRNENYRRRSQSLVQSAPPPPVPPAPPAPPVPPMPPSPFDRTTPVTDYVSGVNRARGVRGTSIDRLADRFSEQRQTNSPVHRSYGNSITHGASASLIGAPPPVPAAPAALMRHHTMDDEIFNNPRGIRVSSDRMMTPRRATQHEYLLEDTDFHALSTQPSSSGSRRRSYQREYLLPQQREEPPPDSVLAGLQGPGRGAHRVFEWSKHVEPGNPDNASIVT